MTASPLTAWVCSVCGYIHYGAEPPEECPVCGAASDQFEAETGAEAPPSLAKAADSIQILVAGAGIAGVSAAEAMRKAAPGAEITLISSESNLPCYRLNLTRYLAGEMTPEQLTIHPASWYESQGILLQMGVRLELIDLGKKTALLSDQSQRAFDRLVLTTGSSPFVPPVKGIDRKNVFNLRTKNDADAILEACQGGRRCICVGGGLLGLETAGALVRQGAFVSVLENQAWLLPRQLNPAASRLFQVWVEDLGIKVITFARLRELTGDPSVRRALLESGDSFPAEAVVFSAGVRSNISLARQAGLATNQGVLVDNHLRTSHPDVYAAGDLCEHRGVLYGTWAPAQSQGEIAGHNAAGQDWGEFTGMPRSNTLKVLGIELFSVGKIAAENAADVVIEGEIDGNYAFFLFQENRLAGSILLGDASLSMHAKKLVETQADCSDLVDHNPGVVDVLEALQRGV
jgi:nitrite reductase (NADH) large subunit